MVSRRLLARHVVMEGMDLMESINGNGLVLMNLRGFIQRYGEELEDYYDEDFGTGKILEDSDGASSVIMCMVDTEKEDHLPVKIKKKIRKAGKFRRNKLKHQWSYMNPLNRIHGYVNLVDVSFKDGVFDDKKVISISSICSSYFSQKKGVGSDLMKISEEFARKMGYTDIILEVANEYAGYAEEPDDEDEEDSGEEDSGEEEEGHGWFPDENVMEILTDELWKKCMRKDKRGDISYNLEKDYINGCLYSYLFYEIDELIDNGVKEVKEIKDEPGENEYGGFWYHKGKNSQKGLQGFYEKFGYKEDSSVHNEWGCFTEIPYPSMRLELV
jgi:ribosomal protein S18 acetylase RimI-like enzyme